MHRRLSLISNFHSFNRPVTSDVKKLSMDGFKLPKSSARTRVTQIVVSRPCVNDAGLFLQKNDSPKPFTLSKISLGAVPKQFIQHSCFETLFQIVKVNLNKVQLHFFYRLDEVKIRK